MSVQEDKTGTQSDISQLFDNHPFAQSVTYAVRPWILYSFSNHYAYSNTRTNYIDIPISTSYFFLQLPGVDLNDLSNKDLQEWHELLIGTSEVCFSFVRRIQLVGNLDEKLVILCASDSLAHFSSKNLFMDLNFFLLHS